jgi:hypothetical protein
MSQSKPETPSRQDQILDLLLDALQERQRARAPKPAPTKPPAEPVAPEPVVEEAVKEMETTAERPEPEPVEEPLPPPAPVPPGQMGKILLRLAVGLLLLVALVNVPINRHGVSLARVLPDSAALIIRDGLLVKAENSEEIYVMQDEKLRWVSSLEAFDHFGYRWRNVHIVEQEFIDRFEKGWPLHVLLKCDASPHIYALENGQKRWIKDIPTFEKKGYVWEDVQFVSCLYLRNLPDGPPIPEDAGPPPQP